MAIRSAIIGKQWKIIEKILYQNLLDTHFPIQFNLLES